MKLNLVLALILVVPTLLFAETKYVNGNQKTNLITGETIDELSIIVSYPNQDFAQTQSPIVEMLGSCFLKEVEPLRLAPLDFGRNNYKYPFAVHVSVDNNCLVWVKNPYDEKTITIVNYEK